MKDFSNLSKHNLKPFFNIVIVICSLFIIVFFKMEIRRSNYSFLRKSRLYGVLQDRYYKNLMIHARLTRSERLEKIAHSRMTLDWAKKGQVIMIIEGKVAVPQ